MFTQFKWEKNKVAGSDLSIFERLTDIGRAPWGHLLRHLLIVLIISAPLTFGIFLEMFT